jgi:hypothetical protein
VAVGAGTNPSPFATAGPPPPGYTRRSLYSYIGKEHSCQHQNCPSTPHKLKWQDKCMARTS